MIRLLQRSLTAKILLAFAIVILVGIGGVAVLANQRTTDLFERYVGGRQPQVLARLAQTAGSVYGQTGSWSTVGQALRPGGGPIGQRIVIVDPGGQIVVDTAGNDVGASAASLDLTNGQAISVKNQTVGNVYLLPAPVVPRQATTGRSGSFGPPRPPGFFGRPPPFLAPTEQAFLDEVNQSLLLAALGAIVAAFLLGILLAQTIVRPLRQLTRGAQRIARGHLDERIQVGGEDEVAQLARAFNQMAESLERTEQARRQLVADVAHELRTPLTIIGGTVQAMRDGVLSLDEGNLATVQQEVESLAHLVSDLRDLSLGDVGQFTIRHEPVDLGEVIQSVGAGFAAEAAARGLHLTVEAPEQLPRVLGDEPRLRQCVRNLVDNAIRHTPGGGAVTIRATAADGAVTIEVADTGEGIAPEHLPRLFERFYRIDRSRARRSGGSGLGLAIVQQIVQAHSGEIQAASGGLSQGATFVIRLPAAPSSPDPVAPAPSSRSLQPSGTHR
jgi:signal transduction histidine kinase